MAEETKEVKTIQLLFMSVVTVFVLWLSDRAEARHWREYGKRYR